MKRIAPFIFVALCALIFGLIWVRSPLDNWVESTPSSHDGPVVESIPEGIVVTESTLVIPTPQNAAAPLVGERILVEYANTNLPPGNDLTLMSRLLCNYFLLVKSAADRPLSANEDWAAAFRGVNSAQERFLPDAHIALNPQGQLVDRWQTPLFFHALGDRRFEIRSAGPDLELWTDDDIQRNADGSFRREADLNPRALWQSSLNSWAR